MQFVRTLFWVLILAALLIFILQWWAGPVAAVGLAAIAVLMTLLAEVGCGVWWLGERFEKLDLSASGQG